MPQKSLYVTSGAPGLVSLNGMPCACLDGEMFALPLPEAGECYVQFFPFGDGLIPAALRIEATEEGPRITGAPVMVWPAGELQVHFTPHDGHGPQPQPAATPQLAAVSALVQNIQAGKRSEAMLALTPSLRGSVGFDTLQSFFGDFDGTAQARFVTDPEGGTLLALYTRKDGVLAMRVFAFDVVEQGGDLLVDNVRAFTQ